MSAYKKSLNQGMFEQRNLGIVCKALEREKSAEDLAVCLGSFG